MKKVLALSLCLLSPTLFAKEINIKVNGMVCSMCAQGIQKKFSKLPEVKEIKVDLDNKIVAINTKGDLDISNERLTEIILEAGYNVAKIERK